MESILALIKPTRAEMKKVELAIASFLKPLNSKLKEGEAILGGSGAKGTWLSGNHDLDIFVAFPLSKYAARSAELADILEKALKKAFPKMAFQRLHGSRDYFQLVYQGFNIEAVPILSISRAAQAVNITDVSPLHTRWVKKRPAKIKDEILLAKQFCKANRLYGAESYIAGFSGYVLEILVSHYGSFKRLLSASLKWKPREVVDVEKHYPKKDALFHLNKSKTLSPLIVIDPVDKDRNAAAALSEKVFLQFQETARRHLKTKSADFFTKKEITFHEWKKEAQKRLHHGVWAEVLLPAGKEDVVGVRLVKALEFLEKQLKPFQINDSGWLWDKKDKAALYLDLATEKRPVFEVRAGPPLHLKEHVIDFKKKNKDCYVLKDKIMARVPVESPLLVEAAVAALKQPYVLEKIRKVIKLETF